MRVATGVELLLPSHDLSLFTAYLLTDSSVSKQVAKAKIITV